jgi:hypothetical protein
VLPIAHAGHFVAILYALPVVIVGVSIAMSVRRERREAREKGAAGEETGDSGRSQQLAEPAVEGGGEQLAHRAVADAFGKRGQKALDD